MKVVCNDGTLDLSKVNDYESCNGKVCCQFEIASYKPEDVTSAMAGKYIKTSDNGVIYFSDIAFKMIFDLCMKAQIDNMRYLKKEMFKTVSDDMITESIKGSSLHEFFNTKAHMKDGFAIDFVAVHNPKDIIKHNLRILADYNIMDDWYKKVRQYDETYALAYSDIIQFINDNIYIDIEHRNFIGVVKLLWELFCNISSDEFKNFVEKFYEMLDKIPDMMYTDRVVEDKTSIDTSKSVKVYASETVESKMEPIVTQSVANSDTTNPKRIKKLHGSDITGKDETYAAGYCDVFYDNEIKNADSEGFLEKLIISRVNEKAAPIDLLSEAISREHSKNTPANTLRRNIANIRENAEEALFEQ